MWYRDNLVRGEGVARSPGTIDGVAKATAAEDESYGLTAIAGVNMTPYCVVLATCETKRHMRLGG